MQKNSWLRTIIWFVLFGILAYLYAIFLASTWDNLANADFTTFWLAGKSVVQGFDAYNSQEWLYWRQFYGATWIFNPTFIYPLPLRLFLAPFGLFPLNAGYILWVILAQFMILLSVIVLYQKFRVRQGASSFPFILIGAYMFHPTILTLRFGQLSPWFLVALVGAILLWENDQWFWGGVVLAFVILKPTIGGIYILVLLLWLTIKKQRRGIAGLAAGGILLLVLGLLQDPLWVSKFLDFGNEKLGDTFAYGPNLWGFSRYLTDGQAVLWMGGLLSLMLMGFFLWLLLKYRDTLTVFGVFSLSTPVIVLITPYIWGYDQLFLLIPMIFIVAVWEKKNGPYLLRSLFFVLIALATYLLQIPAQTLNFDYFSVFLPLGIFILLLPQLTWLKDQVSLPEYTG